MNLCEHFTPGETITIGSDDYEVTYTSPDKVRLTRKRDNRPGYYLDSFQAEIGLRHGQITRKGEP